MSPSEKRPLTAEDLYDLEIISDPQISPDGQHVVFGVARVDKETEKKYTNLWIVPTNGGTPRQFTYGEQTDTHPRWSPDGSEIAFLSNRKEEEQMQIHIIPFYGGEARAVTDIKGTLSGFEWSPDGTKFVAQFRKKDQEAIERDEDEQKKKLGVVMRHITSLSYKFDGAGYLPQEKWHIWTFSASTGEGKQLTEGDFNETEPHWSPDGQQILFISNRDEEWELNPDEVELYLVPAGGGEIRQIETTHHGRKFLTSFSPDGKSIAFLGPAKPSKWQQINRLFVVPVSGGEARNLSAGIDLHLATSTLGDTSGGTLQTSPVWSKNGRTIYVQATEKGSQPLVAFAFDGSGYERIIDDMGCVSSFSLDDNEAKIATLWSTIDMLDQVHVYDVATGKSQALTQMNQALFDEIAWGNIEEVWFKARDGYDLHGWILKPPGFDPDQKYPSIMEIHGGPMAQYGRKFMHEFHYLAAHGYVIYFSNPRGGQGYGEAHCEAIANRWGTVDYDDLMDWADYMEQQPYIDRERMGVTGGSYGGYMTSLIIGKTHRFKAAAAQRLVSNLISMYGSSDMNWGVEQLIGLNTQPWLDLENYWLQSPISYIGNAQTPTLVIHSEKDYRCDKEQGEQVFVALKKLGVDTEMVLFPEEPHGLSRGGRTDRRVQRLSHIRRWFETYLK